MDKLKELANLFENIEVDEKQANAIKEFFSLFSEDVKLKAETELKDEIQTLNEELEKAKSGSESAEAVKKLADFEANAEKAFAAFQEDAETAANRMVEDLKEEHAKQLADALDKLYEDVEARAQEDFKSSKEYASLMNVIKAVKPMIVSDDNKSLLEEIETLNKKVEELTGKTTELSKKDIIAGLVEGFSEEHKKTMIEFMEAAKTEDEIYERFNAVASLIESDTSMPAGDAAGNKKSKKFKRKQELEEKKEEKKQGMNEDTSLIGQSTQTAETKPEVINEHAEILGSTIPGLSSMQNKGLAFLLHAARQAR